MKFLINGSGVRSHEIELTDCELKDLGYCIQQLCEQKFIGEAAYGCTSLSVVPAAERVSQPVAPPPPVVAKLIYHLKPYGMTITCSGCESRILYGTAPIFCSQCGAKFTRYDDSEAIIKEANAIHNAQ